MSAAYRASTLKRDRRNKERLDQLDAQIIAVLKEEREPRQHLRSDIDIDFRRIAINEEQVVEHDLPTKPRKEGDKRSMQVEYTVEAEAMPAATLRAILRVHVESLLPDHALEVAKLTEQSERQHIAKMAALVGA